MLILDFSLDKKLIILVMVVSITSLSITGLLSFNYAEQILIERTNRQLFGESSIRGEALRSLFESRIEQNQILTTNPMIQNLVSELNQTPFENLQNKIQEKTISFNSQINSYDELVGSSNHVENILITGKYGEVFYSKIFSGEGKFDHESMVQYDLKTSVIDFDVVQSREKMVVVSPIFSNYDSNKGEFIGLVMSTSTTDEIDEIILNRSGLGKTGEIVFATKNFVVSSELHSSEETISDPITNIAPFDNCFNEKTGFQGQYRDYKEEIIYGSSYCAKDLGFAVLAKIDQEETIQPILTLQGSIFETGLVITIIMAGITFLVSKTLSKPLIRLKNAANTIAEGNFGVRTKIGSKDEIGQLSVAFDSMAQKLQNSLIEIKQKEETIKQQQDIILQFSEFSEKYCVCFVDIMNSTKISAKLSDSQTSEFYKIFLNYIASIVKNSNGTIVKNIGDALLFYFSVKDSKESALRDCLDCCLKLGEAQEGLALKLEEKSLPVINYRTSATFGNVRIAKTSTSAINDIFGSTVNRCSKINHSAPANGVIIDEEFYENAKNLGNFTFKKVESEITSDSKFIGYVVYRKTK
jgi:class 3 adenylate cyclase